MMSIDEEIRSRSEAFATEIATLVRRAALEAVATTLGTGKIASLAKAPAAVKTTRRAPAAPAPVKEASPVKKVVKAAAPPARKPTKAAPVSKAPASRKPAVAAAPRPSGAKRPPAELAKLTEKLGEYIKGHPGVRMEAIGKALATATRELNLPIKKLLAAKKIRFEGHKRATEYFPV
jgi:hypothetical protein